MKTISVSNINFAANTQEPARIYISKEGTKNTQKLLSMMNQNTKFTLNPTKTSWESQILSSVTMGDKIRFIDSRCFIRPIKEIPKNLKNTKTPDCIIEIGKNRLDINSTTGEILGCKKGIFTGMKSLIKKAERYIYNFICDFNNPETVKKNSFGIQGYTEKGLEILQKHM